MAQPKPTSALRYDALLRLLRAANAIWDASRVFFDHWELSPSQFNVLNLLQSNPEGLSQTDLGRQLLTHRSNVTGLIDRLEIRGFVERKDASTDRRAYRVILTPAGEKLLNTILPHYRREAEHVWDGVSDRALSELLETLDSVRDNAVKGAATGAPSTIKERVP